MLRAAGIRPYGGGLAIQRIAIENGNNPIFIKIVEILSVENYLFYAKHLIYRHKNYVTNQICVS